MVIVLAFILGGIFGAGMLVAGVYLEGCER